MDIQFVWRWFDVCVCSWAYNTINEKWINFHSIDIRSNLSQSSFLLMNNKYFRLFLKLTPIHKEEYSNLKKKEEKIILKTENALNEIRFRYHLNAICKCIEAYLMPHSLWSHWIKMIHIFLKNLTLSCHRLIENVNITKSIMHRIDEWMAECYWSNESISINKKKIGFSSIFAVNTMPWNFNCNLMIYIFFLIDILSQMPDISNINCRNAFQIILPRSATWVEISILLSQLYESWSGFYLSSSDFSVCEWKREKNS